MTIEYSERLIEEVRRSDDNIYNYWPDPSSFWMMGDEDRSEEPYFSDPWDGSESFFVVLDYASEIRKISNSCSIEQAVREPFPLLASWKQAVMGSGTDLPRFSLWFNGVRANDFGYKHRIHVLSQAVSRPELEVVTERYLAGGVRSAILERSLIRALLGVEIIDYLSSTHGQFELAKACQGLPSKILGKQAVSKDRVSRVAKTTAVMQNCYDWLDTRSTVPVTELIHSVRRSRDVGIVWPGALLALLSDLEQRKAMFLPLVRYHPA